MLRQAAGPAAARPHVRPRLPGRCTAASALRASTGRLRAGAGTPTGTTRPEANGVVG
jgi:hypothetical protein